MRRREGRYLLRANLTETNPVKLWNYYLQLGKVEEAFRTLKSDPAIRPIFHQDQQRIEAHVFIAFLAYCLYVTLGRQLKPLAQGLTARSALEKLAVSVTNAEMLQKCLPLARIRYRLRKQAEELGPRPRLCRCATDKDPRHRAHVVAEAIRRLRLRRRVDHTTTRARPGGLRGRRGQRPSACLLGQSPPPGLLGDQRPQPRQRILEAL